MSTIPIIPTWRAAAQIFIMCIENGDSEEAKQGARNEILAMADKLDALRQEQLEAKS